MLSHKKISTVILLVAISVCLAYAQPLINPDPNSSGSTKLVPNILAQVEDAAETVLKSVDSLVKSIDLPNGALSRLTGDIRASLVPEEKSQVGQDVADNDS